jgi:hypothetical protein
MSAHLPTMPPRTSGDITITTTHREVMRRLDRGESLTDAQVDTLGALYLHELVDDVVVDHVPRPALTPLGRRVLDVGGVLTTRQERPRLVSMPIPKGWVCDRWLLHAPTSAAGSMGAHRPRNRPGGVTNGHDPGCRPPRKLGRVASSLASTGCDHEDAVRAQDGGS